MLAPQNIKYLGIELTKYVQDLYKENYEILMKSKENQINYRYSVFMDRKTQYFQDFSSSQVNL